MTTQRPGKQPQNHLQTLLDGFVDFRGDENCELSFKGLTNNSKKVHEEFLFLACAGTVHGIAYAGEAIKRGANCVLWEPTAELQDMPSSCVVKDAQDVPLIRVEALHEKAGEIAARFYQQPSRTLNVIGITGTNGKTSTAHFIAQLIHLMKNKDAEGKCAVIGTLGNGIYGALEQATHTTPDAVTLQGLMADFRNSQADTLVMEVSSHALAQGRVNSVDFDTAIFTNLSRDHMDYHGDMKHYADEKLKLFQYTSLKHIVVNLDDDFSSAIITSVATRTDTEKPDIVTYSRNDKTADFYACDIRLNQKGIAFTLTVSDAFSSEKKTYKVNSHLIGDFNIENLLAAIAALYQHGYELEAITAAISKLITVPGRMEKISVQAGGDLPLIVVDYAHTPDALEKGLKALRAHTQGKLCCLFGCGGDRDKGKRPLMANVAEQYSDISIVTTDNPRSESPEQIINEIIAGYDSLANVSIEADREQAIKKILQSASADDAVLIAGKGHEDYQEINGARFPFSDKACVLSILAERNLH